MSSVRANLFSLICATALVCGAPLTARPYVHYYADAGATIPLRWGKQPIHISLSSSLKRPPANIESGSDVVGATLRALKHWEEVADLSFVVSWSDEQSGNSGNKGDGVSLITVADTPVNRTFFSGSLLGHTNVIFKTETGQIGEADIIISPAQKFSTDGTFGTFDLESTLTHEVGHLLGLDHSEIKGAVMQGEQFVNGLSGSPRLEGRVLSEDDREGVWAIYGS
jgi:hypothetical protein